MLVLPLLMSFTCEVQAPSALDSFSAFENYPPELKECLEKTAKLCQETKTDKSTENFKTVSAKAFDKVKRSKEFTDFYCENFQNGKLSFDGNRKCDLKLISKELEQKHSCEFIPKNDDNATEAQNICGQFVIDELKKPDYLTPELKTNFKKTLVNVIDGFKKIYPKNKNVADILSKISLDTDFEFRLSTFVAGARERNELQGCDATWGEASWCKGDYFILPGGRIFSEPQNLELIIAHEVGHIINKVDLPEKEYGKTTAQLKACNHLDSQRLDIDQLRSETSADIHMAKYYREFMKGSDVKTHFCQYEQKNDYLKSTYLHPYHRQALLNCSF